MMPTRPCKVRLLAGLLPDLRWRQTSDLSLPRSFFSRPAGPPYPLVAPTPSTRISRTSPALRCFTSNHGRPCPASREQEVSYSKLQGNSLSAVYRVMLFSPLCSSLGRTCPRKAPLFYVAGRWCGDGDGSLLRRWAWTHGTRGQRTCVPDHALHRCDTTQHRSPA